MKIAVIDYGAGNVQSVLFALERLGEEGVLTADPSEIRTADKVIFPGVGEAASAMLHLTENGLINTIKNLTQPALGICLGMQLMCSKTEEGDVAGLGVIDADVKRFPNQDETGTRFKVPHIGWNAIGNLSGPLFDGIPEGSFAYFVHSFYAELNDATVATTNYALPFTAAVTQNNFYATQFHPEKSGAVGDRLLRNFLDLQSN